MTTNKPDPLGIRKKSERHCANERKINTYYNGGVWVVTSECGMCYRLEIDGNNVTQWRISLREAYAELADKIRDWEVENPEVAIKVNQ